MLRSPSLGDVWTHCGLIAGLAAVSFALVGFAACAGPGPTGPAVSTPASSTPVASSHAASWPVSPEVLPAPTSGNADVRLTCGGGPKFQAAGLEAPTGAEKVSGPAFDALRDSLAKFGSEFPGSSAWTWQLAGMDETGAIFLARTDGPDGARWAAVTVAVDGTGWHPGGMGVGCEPTVVLSAEYGPAGWALDPAYASPAPDTTELHILVWEMACSDGSPATGRMSAPIVESGPSTVTMTIGVRPLGGVHTCPGPPGTPAIVRLAEPLGPRTLLDGGRVPPAAPSPMF